MSGKDPAGPDQAILFLDDVRERLTVITFNAKDYVDAIVTSAASGVVGGGIYDVLIARCAVKGKAEAIYTCNVKHFTRIGPEVASRVKIGSGVSQRTG